MDNPYNGKTAAKGGKMTQVNRRSFVKTAMLAAGTLALPGKVFAQPYAAGAAHRRILDVARREAERAGSSLARKDIVAIADFGLRSSEPRFHFANLEKGSVRSFLVSHGQGSDPDHNGWLKYFSNQNGSFATSRGAYATSQIYEGKYGTSMRLDGLDRDNSNARDRAIVIHPAWYAEASMITKWGKLGRSQGCFAMDPSDFHNALAYLAGGRLLYADRLGIA